MLKAMDVRPTEVLENEQAGGFATCLYALGEHKVYVEDPRLGLHVQRLVACRIPLPASLE